MFKFKILDIGDVFNTLSGRWAKTSTNLALCIMSSVHEVGSFAGFEPDQSVIPLYSSSPEVNKLISLIDKGMKDMGAAGIKLVIVGDDGKQIASQG